MRKSQELASDAQEFTETTSNSKDEREANICFNGHHLPVLSAANIRHSSPGRDITVSQCATLSSHSTRTVILLIGAPGAGKSLLGIGFSGESRGEVEFLSVGNRLRELGKLDGHHAIGELRQDAQALVGAGLQRLVEGVATTLVLEYVKEVDDAFELMGLLRAHPAVKLSQVLYISDEKVGKALLKKAGHGRAASVHRDVDRRVEERQSKWLKNVGGLLEIFTSLGITTEVGVKGHDNTTPLARLGYAVEDGSSDAERLQWASGLCLPSELSFVQLQWVVSPRLMTDKGFVDALLREAEEATGLRVFSEGEKLPVPSTPIVGFGDAEWVGWPDRYCVSRKCDGTRHLLIVGQQDGVARFRNRVGFMYEYPVRTPLRAGAVLDGELVWIGGKGFFIAFDVIATGPGRGARAWQLPLLDRVSLLSEELSLEEAEACADLLLAAKEQQPSTPTGHFAWDKAQDAWERYVEEAGAQELEKRKATDMARRKSQSELSRHRRVMSAGTIAVLSFEQWKKTPKYQDWYAAALRDYLSRQKHRVPEMRLLHRKQQAPATDAVTVVWKRHLDVSAVALEGLASSLKQCPYPTDGLVFTPKEAPYALGMAELLRKWQPAEQAAGDISLGQVEVMLCPKPMVLLHGLVYECRLVAVDPRQALLWHCAGLDRARTSGGVRQWLPDSIRWDKSEGNSPGTLARLRTTAPLSYQVLIDRIARTQDRCASRLVRQVTRNPPLHPARTYPGDVYGAVMVAVAEGRVERTVDAGTGLEIFNHKRVPGKDATPIEGMCRGLVCHQSRVVATPFTPFDHQTHFADPLDSEVAHASFKVDGSLAIAFLWDGGLQVCTRRRMDSQQALWAKDWLRGREAAAAFVPGWTYLFEAVFRDNTVVVPYQFDALVLLAAIAPDGARLPHVECLGLAKRMGVMLAPSVAGTVTELVNTLAIRTDNDCLAEHTARPRSRDPFAAGRLIHADLDKHLEGVPPARRRHAPPKSEGWVLTRNDSDGGSTKLVSESYKEASREAGRLHPLCVWDRVRTGGESRHAMLYHSGLPVHLREDLGKVLDALQSAYDEARSKVGRSLVLGEVVDPSSGLAGAVEAARGMSRIVAGTLDQRMFEDVATAVRPESMHYECEGGGCGMMRVLLLDCIKPRRDGTLDGYTPSSGLALTFAKGWPGGVRCGRMSEQEPLICAKFGGLPILDTVLDLLDGFEMGCAMLVNKEWGRVIRAAPGFGDKVQQRVDHLRTRRAHRGRGRFLSDSDSDGFVRAYSSSLSLDGYGSW
jgi:hypothetical protein